MVMGEAAKVAGGLPNNSCKYSPNQGACIGMCTKPTPFRTNLCTQMAKEGKNPSPLYFSLFLKIAAAISI